MSSVCVAPNASWANATPMGNAKGCPGVSKQHPVRASWRTAENSFTTTRHVPQTHQRSSTPWFIRRVPLDVLMNLSPPACTCCPFPRPCGTRPGEASPPLRNTCSSCSTCACCPCMVRVNLWRHNHGNTDPKQGWGEGTDASLLRVRGAVLRRGKHPRISAME